MKYYFYATKNNDGIYTNIFGSRKQMKLCGDNNPTRIEVTIDENGDYFGWKDNKGKLSMIFKDMISLTTCFPYKMSVHIENGDGEIVKIMIKECKDID